MIRVSINVTTVTCTLGGKVLSIFLLALPYSMYQSNSVAPMPLPPD